METATAISARSLQYYVIGKRWASDLEFFKIETAFLHRLLGDYFARMCDPVHVVQLNQVSKMLRKLEDDEKMTSELLKEQIVRVELIAEDFILENSGELETTHLKLEYLMLNLTTAYRGLKKEMFELIETVLRQENFPPEQN